MPQATRGRRRPSGVAAAGPTFSALADEWLDGVRSGAVGRRRGQKGIGYSPTTLEGYERSLRYVLAARVRRPARRRDRRLEWQTWVDRLSREGLSRSRIANHLAVARAIYGWACSPDPPPRRTESAAGIELPPNDEKPRRASPTPRRPPPCSPPSIPRTRSRMHSPSTPGCVAPRSHRLDWPDVELEGYRLVVRKAKSEAGTGRRPPIAEPLRPILRAEFMRQGRRERAR